MNDYVGREVMEHDGRRAAFNALAKKTFGLSFEAWYRDGYWTEKYMPYTLFDGARAVSNVSVNRLDVVYEGNTYLMHQLGTVMTDPEYRGQGYAARLIRRIQEEYLESCDTMFLFANKNVLDFYPKFGFEKRIQYGFRLNCRNGAGRRERKLDMDQSSDRQLLQKFYEKGNLFSVMQVVRNPELLMFYCMGPLRDCIRYIPGQDAVVIVEWEEGIPVIYDIYCDPGKNLQDILSAAGAGKAGEAILKFTPPGSEHADWAVEGDTGFRTFTKPAECGKMKSFRAKNRLCGQTQMFISR